MDVGPAGFGGSLNIWLSYKNNNLLLYWPVTLLLLLSLNLSSSIYPSLAVGNLPCLLTCSPVPCPTTWAKVFNPPLYILWLAGELLNEGRDGSLILGLDFCNPTCLAINDNPY